MKKINIENLIITLLILIVPITIYGNLFENDLFFDIKTGESILKYGIDFKDHFSFHHNLIYLYHHWLYDLIIFFIYKIFNYNGIRIFFVLINSLFGFIYFNALNKYSPNKIFSAIITLFILIITNYAFQSRVQSITYILFFLEIIYLNKLYAQGKKKDIFILSTISILILNLHMPLWILFVILLLPYLFEATLYLIHNRKSELKKESLIEKTKNYKITIICFLIILFTGLITPLKLNSYTFFIKVLKSNSYSFISEMQKTILFYHYWVWIILLIFIILTYSKLLRIKIRDFMLVIGLFVFSLLANRNVIYFLIVCPFIIIKSIEYEKISNTNLIKKIKCMLNNSHKTIIKIFSIVFISIIYIFNIKINFINITKKINDAYPDKTVLYIKKNLDYKNIKQYNDFNYGSYLEFYNIPVFIDSRAEVYVKNFNGGKDIVSDYLKTNDMKSYKEVFKKYKFNYAIVETNSNINYYLSINTNWKLIFKEKGFRLYKKIQ